MSGAAPDDGAKTPPGCRIGTSGFHYEHWRGVLYPDDLPAKHWFERYAEVFDTVEINNTFYQLPDDSTFDAWRERAARGFLYALKYSRYGTHIKKLKDPEEHLEKFVSGARRLGGHLGPVLVQLPPNWRADPGRLDAFLGAAPDEMRWAVEFRDPSWLTEEVFGVLEAHGTALCVHDLVEDHPRRVTAGRVYLRYHGPERYAGDYPYQKLTAEARRIRGHLEEGRDVYAFFNNDLGGHAVHNALDLRRYVAGG